MNMATAPDAVRALFNDARVVVNADSMLTSFLHDLDLLPEQITTQRDLARFLLLVRFWCFLSECDSREKALTLACKVAENDVNIET